MNLIRDYEIFADNGLSPAAFRRWSMIGAIAAVLDRKVYTVLSGGVPIYPNMFIMLVAQPATGKGQAISPLKGMLSLMDNITLGNDSTTYQEFVRQLGELSQKPREETDKHGLPVHKASMALFLLEWGVFMSNPDQTEMAVLAQIFDNEDISRSTIGRGLDLGRNLYVNIVAGACPAWFAEGFPPNAYDQGLPTRFFFIYADPTPVSKTPAYTFTENVANAPKAILDKFYGPLQEVTKAQGFVEWSLDASTAMNDWKSQDFMPAPTDAMLQGYNGRRPLHLAKLSTIVAMSRHPNRLVIDLKDFKTARQYMLEAEKTMPKALSVAGGNTYQLRMDSVALYVAAAWRKTERGVPEWRVRRQLSRTVPPNLVRIIVDELIEQRRLNVRSGEAPSRILEPGVLLNG